MQYGLVRLQIKGSMPEKMLNIAAKRGLFFKNVIQTDANTLEGEISIAQFRKLRSVAKKARCRIHILQKKEDSTNDHKRTVPAGACHLRYEGKRVSLLSWGRGALASFPVPHAAACNGRGQRDRPARLLDEETSL